jgi:hypothetical protein
MVKESSAALEKLQATREGVGQFKLSVSEMAGYYTPTIHKLLAVIEHMAVLSTNVEITDIIAAYTSMLEAKESAGVERAMGAAGRCHINSHHASF